MSSFFAVSLVLLLIFVSSRFVKYLAEAATGSFSSDVLLLIMLYRLPGFLELILPLALFLAIMLAYGRLYVESEMIVLQACGISKARLIAYTLGPALIIMFIVSGLTLYLTPKGWKNFHDIWNDPNTFNSANTIVPGSFRFLSGKENILYVADMNESKTELYDVLLARTSHDDGVDTVQLIKASEAVIQTRGDQSKYIQLADGHIYRVNINQLDLVASHFKTYGQLLSESRSSLVVIDSVDALPTEVLLLAHDGDKQEAAMYWRVLMPFLVPIVALLALGLSETSHRRGRYIKLLPGIVAYIFYLALLIAAKSEMEKGKLNGPLPFLLVHLGFFCMAMSVIYFTELKAFVSRGLSK